MPEYDVTLKLRVVADDRADAGRLAEILVDFSKSPVVHFSEVGSIKATNQFEAVKFTELIQTCSACPSQWEGTTDDGRQFYARYRWGGLTWGFGHTLSDAIDNSMRRPSVRLGDGLDGVLLTEGMLEIIGLTKA